MNDKIKELATQIEHWEIYDNGGKPIVYDNKPYGAASHMVFSSIQKFAELIIQECIEACNENNKQVQAHLGVSACVKSIKQRFGITDAPST